MLEKYIYRSSKGTQLYLSVALR